MNSANEFSIKENLEMKLKLVLLVTMVMLVGCSSTNKKQALERKLTSYEAVDFSDILSRDFDQQIQSFRLNSNLKEKVEEKLADYRQKYQTLDQRQSLLHQAILDDIFVQRASYEEVNRLKLEVGKVYHAKQNLYFKTVEDIKRVVGVLPKDFNITGLHARSLDRP